MKNILFTLLILSVAVPAWSMTDRETIAMVIAAESAGEGVKGMELVAEVVRNRAGKSKNYLKVVTAKNQFYGYTAKNRHKLYKSVKAQADKIVDDMYAGKLGNKTDGALYFRRPDEPMFKWCKVRTFAYKSHVFYR